MQEKSRKNIILIITTISSFITPFMSSSINIAMPSIGKEFGANAIMLNWIATSFLLTTAALLLPAGRLADIYSRVRVMKAGVITYIAGSVLCSVSFSGEFLIAGRVVQGAGAAMLFSTSTAILVSSFPFKERGKVLGINTASVYTGLSLGPVLGGFITQHLGWRFIFNVNILLGFIVLLLMLKYMKKEPAAVSRNQFDIKGSLFYAVVLSSIIYGFSLLPDAGGFIFIAAGTALFFLFIKMEMKVDEPVLNVGLFRNNRTFAFSNLAAIINYSATFAVGFLLSLYLQYIKGMTPQQAGMILVAQPVVMAIFSPLSGRASDRIEPQTVASAGMTITAIGLFILIFLGKDTGITFIIISLVFLGFGFALFSSPNVNAIMSSVDKNLLSVASATQSTMRMTGQMLSMGFVMLIFSLFIGKAKIGVENQTALLNAIRAVFVLFAVLCVAGIFASLARGKMREEKNAEIKKEK